MRKFFLQSFIYIYIYIYIYGIRVILYSAIFVSSLFSLFSYLMAWGGNQNVNNDSCQVVHSSNMSLMEDYGSPFYLHNCDYLGLVLVSYHLIGSNYNTWSRSMFMALTIKNKVGFVDGSITRPTYEHLLFNVWTRCNSMVISWILNVMSREIRDILLYIDNVLLKPGCLSLWSFSPKQWSSNFPNQKAAYCP